MSIHIETHMKAAGDHAAEVIVTDTGEVIHLIEGQPSQAEARRLALEWMGRQIIAWREFAPAEPTAEAPSHHRRAHAVIYDIEGAKIHPVSLKPRTCVNYDPDTMMLFLAGEYVEVEAARQ